VIEPERLPELVRERRVVGVVSDRADAELLLEAPPSEPTNRRTSSRLTAFLIGKSLASMRKPLIVKVFGSLWRFKGSDVVFRSRNFDISGAEYLVTS